MRQKLSSQEQTKQPWPGRYGISDSQLYAWRKLLRDEADIRFPPVITEEISPNKDDGSSSSIDIVLSNGHRITVSDSVDPAHVERLLRALATT